MNNKDNELAYFSEVESVLEGGTVLVDALLVRVTPHQHQVSHQSIGRVQVQRRIF